MTTVRRFIQAYRWELTLLVVVPAFVTVISFLSRNLLFKAIDYVGIEWSFILGSSSGVLSGAALLGLCYIRVRRINQQYLMLLWTCSILSDIIRGLAELAIWAFAVVVTDATDSHAQTISLLYLVIAGLHLPLLLVFARQASRFSLWHGFFLYLVFESYALPNVVVFLGLTESRATASLYWLPIATVWSLSVGCSLAWLLGNLESRGDSFRRRATAVLFVAQAVLLFHVIAMAGHALFMALIYLVRVRRTNMDEQYQRPLQTH